MFTESKEKEIGKLSFTNHNYEFLRFYENHRRLNEELSGLREIVYHERGVEKKILLNRSNFWNGIKRVQAFVHDNRQYIASYEDGEAMVRLLDNFENTFLNDQKYWEFIKKEQDLNREDSLEFSLKHIQYMIQCFKIVDRLFKLLQKTILISTNEVKKIISYENNRNFHEKLSEYRDVVVNDLAFFKLSNALDYLRLALSYTYTYKFLFDSRIMHKIDAFIEREVLDHVLSKKVLDIILYLNSGQSLTTQKRKEVAETSLEVKKRLLGLYYMCNVFLSRGNVLPNIDAKVYNDTTPFQI